MTRLNKEWFREEREEKSSSDSRSMTKMWMKDEEKQKKVQKKRFIRDRQRWRYTCVRKDDHDW